MIVKLPSRVGQLIERLERGDVVTQVDVDRLATLQALDLVKAGEDFAIAIAEEEERRTQEFSQL